MSDNETELKDGRLSYRQAIVVALISAVLSGSGVPWFLSALDINPYRSDPYTGTQGILVDRRLDALEEHVNEHPDVALRADISDIKAEIAAMNARQDGNTKMLERILDRLE